MRLFVLICLFYLLIQPQQCRSDYYNLIGGGIGYHSYVFIDHHASPMRYRNAGTAYSLQYVRDTCYGQHRLIFGYDGGIYTAPESAPGRMFEDYFRIRFQGGYMHGIGSFIGGSARILGGFHIDNEYTHRNHYYFDNWNELFIGYIASFHPAFEIVYRPAERHRIRTRLGGSTIALLVRNPYSIRGKRQASFQFFDSFLQADWLLSYGYKLNDRIETEIMYNFRYTRHSVPHDYKGAGDRLWILFGYRI